MNNQIRQRLGCFVRKTPRLANAQRCTRELTKQVLVKIVYAGFCRTITRNRRSRSYSKGYEATVSMSIDRYNSALARLRTRPILDNIGLSKKVGSCSALFFEYLRRGAVLCDVLEDARPYPLGDFLSACSPQIGPDLSIERAVESIPPDKDRAWRFREGLMTNLLRWEKYSDESGLDQGLELYEPLLVFFDRGGSFYRENALVYISSAGLNVRTVQSMINYPPLKSLNREFLDQIDAEWPY